MSLRRDLEKWAEAGLISLDQASAIEEYEGGRPTAVSRGVEAVAYLGATLVLVALFMLGRELWDQLEPWGQLTLALVVTVVLYVVGLILGRSEDAAVKRAQTFSWALAVAGFALSGFVLFERILDMRDRDAALWTALAALVLAVYLWIRRRSTLQVIAVGVACAVSMVTLLGRFEGLPDWSFGLSFAALGTIWLLLTWAGVLSPERTSYALGAVGVLFIAFPESNDMPWPLLGLLAALILLGLSVRLNQQVLMGLGVAGLFVYVPMTVFEWFGDSLGSIAALLITGLILLGAVVGVVQVRRS